MLGTLTQDPGQGAAGAAVRAVLDESPNLAPGYGAVRRAADTAGAGSASRTPLRWKPCSARGCTSARPGSKNTNTARSATFAVHFKGRAARKPNSPPISAAR